MKRDTVEQFKKQPEAKPGLWARFSGWVKGIFSKGTKAAGKLIPRRVADKVTAFGRSISTSFKKAWNYVVPPLKALVRKTAIILLLATAISLAVAGPLVALLVVLSVAGATLLTFVTWAYLLAAKDKGSKVASFLLSVGDAIGFSLLIGMGAFFLMVQGFTVLYIVAGFALSGMLAKAAILTAMAGYVYLHNAPVRVKLAAKPATNASEPLPFARPAASMS